MFICQLKHLGSQINQSQRMPEYLQLEFVKIFNWTDRLLEARLVISWSNPVQLLLDKKTSGQMKEDSLIINLPLRVQLVQPLQNLRVQLLNSQGRSLGAAELTLQGGMQKQKIHYLSFPNSQNKIIQINITPEQDARPRHKRDVSAEYQRVVQQTMERKVTTNIELKRNDLFIQGRQKFLTDYSRSRSKSSNKNFPSKISSLLQEVRQIKNSIRLSSSRSSSRIITPQTNITPSRFSSLHSIDEKPKLLQRSPRDLRGFPTRSPRRFESDNNCKFVPLSPDQNSEYGIIKSKIPQSRVTRQNPYDRPSYLIPKNR